MAGLLGIGECLHGAVQAPLVTDLADERLMGRYMAASAFSWSAGFAIGPAIGGFMLGQSADRAVGRGGTGVLRRGRLDRGCSSG